MLQGIAVLQGRRGAELRACVFVCVLVHLCVCVLMCVCTCVYLPLPTQSYHVLLQVNVENALMRYEFLESIVRAGIAKYGKGVVTDDVAEAVRMILAQNIAPNLPPGEPLLVCTQAPLRCVCAHTPMPKARCTDKHHRHARTCAYTACTRECHVCTCTGWCHGFQSGATHARTRCALDTVNARSLYIYPSIYLSVNLSICITLSIHTCTHTCTHTHTHTHMQGAQTAWQGP